MIVQVVEVFVPCDVITVQVRVGPQKALSTLEELFLTAVLQGVSSFEQLAGLFSIGRRPTLDLVFDLWQKGYVVLDLTQGAVLPSTKISLDKLHELQGAEETEELRRLMLDRLTGQVMPLGGLLQLPQGAGKSVVLVEQFEVGLHDVTTAALLGALRRVIAKEDRPDGGEEDGQTRRKKKVLGAHLSLTNRSKTSERRWLPVRIQCSRSSEEEGLQVAVIESEMPAEARAIAARRLIQILEEQPESDFAKFLEASASVAAVNTTSLEELLGRLEASVESLHEVPPSLWELRHKQLLEMTEHIEEILIERRNTEVGLEIVTSQIEQVKLLISLVQGAVRQVVIASTWIYLEEVESLVPVLLNRLEQGVQCYILWGFKPDDELTPQIRNALLPLRTRYPALFFVAERSCREHAKLVIQDDRRALVSSMSVLRPSEERTFEASVVLSAQEGQPCAPIEAALRWARETYPDFIIAQGIYTTYEEFNDQNDSLETEQQLPPPSGPTSKSFSPKNDEDLDVVATRLWQMAWQDYTLAIHQFNLQITTTARLLRDGEHRDILWQALKSVKRRLLITSDRLGPEVFNERFVAQLRERLKAGVVVTLLHRRFAAQGDSRLDDVRRNLASLRDYPRFRWLENVDNHSKILVFDDTALIGSFNFLSFSGYYVEGRPSLRRRQRSEVGALIASGEVADRILEAVSARFPEAFDLWAPTSARPREVVAYVSARPRHANEYGELLAALSEAPDEQRQAFVLRQWIAAAKDPWELLDSLEAAGFPTRLRRVTIAAALSGNWLVSFAEPQRRWLLWLAENSWDQRHFVEAAVLAGAGFGEKSARLPRPLMTLLAAAQSIGRPAPVIASLSRQTDLTQSERFVLAGVSLIDVALRGTYDSLLIFEQLRSALPPTWNSVAGSFKEYWGQAWQALPVRNIRADVESEALRKQIEEAFRKLAELWQKAAETHFKFISGTKTHDWLFDRSRLFGELGILIQQRDSEGVQKWIQRDDGMVSSIDKLSALIDYATEQVDPGRPIRREKRASYEEGLSRVVSAAQEVAALAATSEGSKESHLIELAAAFGSALAVAWQRLEAEVLGSSEPERVILSEAMKELRMIAEWANK